VKKSDAMLREDSSKIYNKWVSGIAKRELQPEVITVSDIVNRFRNSSDAIKSFPYPLQNIVDFLGDLFVQAANLRRLLSSSLSNPTIKDSKVRITAIRSLNDKLDKIQNEIFSCTEELNNLVEK